MGSSLAAIFDVDGVLVESLPAHLEMCALMSREYGLGLTIPGVDDFRALVRRGVPISPMTKFFEAVGFPLELAERADAEYEASFAARFSPPAFPGVPDMLRRLEQAGVELGIVSSNTRANVEKALGEAMRAFPAHRVFTRDHARAQTKPDALRVLVSELGLPKERIFYVGDQPADAVAAREVGLPFIGATYGWGIAPGDEEQPGPVHGALLVASPVEIADRLLARVASLS